MQKQIHRLHPNPMLLWKSSTHFSGEQWFLAIFVVLVSLLLSGNSYASGSYSTGGGGANQIYHLGKKALYQKLICTTCPLANLALDVDQAKDIISRLNGDEEFSETLTGKDRETIAVYLKRRYRL